MLQTAIHIKLLSGSYNVRNKYLKKILEKYGKNNDEIWSTITTNQGSVSHLDFLTDLEKDTFKTAFEIDQRWIVELVLIEPQIYHKLNL